MRRIEKAFGGRIFALAVFLAVYVGLLAIAFAPREGIGASPYHGSSGTSHAAVQSPVIAAQ